MRIEQLAGNTVRFYCDFYNFAKAKTDPSLIKFKIYDSKYELLEEISLNLVTSKISTGSYFYNFIVPMEYLNKRFYYEFYAEIEGLPSIYRDEFYVNFS